MTYLRLTIEPIPATSRLSTLAKLLPRGQWNQLRRVVYRRAGYRCQICGRDGRLHCHEVWQYNERTGYQWLRGFQALCQDCHGAKHLMFVRDSQQRARLFRHFLTVNRLTQEQGMQHLAVAYQQRQRLNKRSWIVNYGEFNWLMPPTASVQQRQNYARLNRPRYH